MTRNMFTNFVNKFICLRHFSEKLVQCIMGHSFHWTSEFKFILNAILGNTIHVHRNVLLRHTQHVKNVLSVDFLITGKNLSASLLTITLR